MLNLQQSDCSLSVLLPHAGNARHLQTLMTAAQKLGSFLQQAAAGGDGGGGGNGGTTVHAAAAKALSVNDFLFAVGLDNLNLFSVLRCLPEIRIDLWSL